MFKKIRIESCALLVLFFLLCGCDPALKYRYYVDNSSDSTINVTFNCKKNTRFIITKYFPNDSSIQVLPHNEVLIFETLIPDCNPHDEKDEFLKVFDKIEFTKSGAESIKKNIYVRENWTYKRRIHYMGIIKTGINTYKIKLANEDI